MSINWDEIEYFKPEEFDDPDYPGSYIYMSEATIMRIDSLRIVAGWPIIMHNKYGVHGCVCMQPYGHSENSRHYVNNECDAIDWHFKTDAEPREQAIKVLQSGFRGIGIYYDWIYGNKLSIGFHTDMRQKPQIWKREGGQYIYLLN